MSVTWGGNTTDAYITGWKHAHADKIRGAEDKSQWFTDEDDYSRGYRDGYREGKINAD